MAPNINAMIQEGIKAFKAGNKAEARTLLEKAVELDAYNEQGWLWLSAVVDTPEEQRTCLENVLFINPDNANAKQGIETLDRQMGSSVPSTPSPAFSDPAPAPTTHYDDPLAEASFTDPEPSAQDYSAPPIATSSASAIYDPASELTSDDYDNWAAGLKLSTSDPVESAPPRSSAFTDVDKLFDANYFDDENTGQDTELDDLRSASFSDFGLDHDDDLGNASFDSFGADDLLVDDDTPFQAAPAFDDTPFEMEDIDLPESTASSSRSSSRSAREVMSPVESRKSPKESSSMRGGALITDEDYEEDYDDWEHDPEEFFKYIPKGIAPTRLPGSKERVSPLIMGTLGLLLLLNIGAVVFLVMNVTS